ncbi:MAG: Fic family protein [Nitrospirota bacterium]
MISKYSTEWLIEAEFQPGSRGRVLKNKLGITGKRKIDCLETQALLETQEYYYRVISKDDPITEDLIKGMHYKFLGEIYEWAGNYRKVNLSKGGFTWPPAYLVAKNMAEFEKNTLLVYTPCKVGSIDDVANSIAIVHSEFLLVHPFREGNGRIARLISDLMALQSDFPVLDFDFSKRRTRDNYIKAVTQGYKQNYEPLKSLIRKVLVKSIGEFEK